MTTLEEFLKGEPLKYVGYDVRRKPTAVFDGRGINIDDGRQNFRVPANEVEASRFYHNVTRGQNAKETKVDRNKKQPRSRRR